MALAPQQSRHDYSTTNPPPAYVAAQWLAFVVGLVLTLAGIVGFFVPGQRGFASHQGASLLGLHVNPLHNLVHLVTGVLGLATWRTIPTSRAYGAVLAIAYGATFVYGLFAVGRRWDVLALNWPDNILHLVLACLGVAIAAGANSALRRHGPKII